jgi:hypothetical protein
MKIGIVGTMKRVIRWLCVPVALAAIACADGRGVPTSPTESRTSNVAVSSPGNNVSTAAKRPVTGPQEPAAGCPAMGDEGENSRMTFLGILSSDQAVALSVAQITDAWYPANGFVKAAYIADRLAAVNAEDKNGDGLVCLARNWGQDLNPNSHWALFYGDLLNPPFTERYYFSDNHVGTANKK